MRLLLRFLARPPALLNGLSARYYACGCGTTARPFCTRSYATPPAGALSATGGGRGAHRRIELEFCEEHSGMDHGACSIEAALTDEQHFPRLRASAALRRVAQFAGDRRRVDRLFWSAIVGELEATGAWDTDGVVATLRELGRLSRDSFPVGDSALQRRFCRLINRCVVPRLRQLDDRTVVDIAVFGHKMSLYWPSVSDAFCDRMAAAVGGASDKRAVLQLAAVYRKRRRMERSAAFGFERFVEMNGRRLSADELSVICLAFYGSQRVFKHARQIMDIVNDKFVGSLRRRPPPQPDSGPSAYPAATSSSHCLAKSIGLNAGRLRRVLPDRLVNSVCERGVIENESPVVWKHIASVLARCGQYSPEFFARLQRHTLDNMRSLRGKDVVRIVGTISAFNRGLSEEFVGALLEEFRSERRAREAQRFPTTLLELLTSLAAHDIYPEDMLDTLLSADYMRRMMSGSSGIFTNSPISNAFRLDCSVAIDRPDYTGNRLDSSFMPLVKQAWPWIVNGVRTRRTLQWRRRRPNASRRGSRPLSVADEIAESMGGGWGHGNREARGGDTFRRRLASFEGEQNATFRDKFMHGVADSLRRALNLASAAERDLVKLAAAMPHDLFFDVLLCFDGGGELRHAALPQWGRMGDAWRVPDGGGERRVLFTCALDLCYEKPLRHHVPMAHWAHRIRCLRKLGYTVVVLPRHKWPQTETAAPSAAELAAYLRPHAPPAVVQRLCAELGPAIGRRRGGSDGSDAFNVLDIISRM